MLRFTSLTASFFIVQIKQVTAGKIIMPTAKETNFITEVYWQNGNYTKYSGRALFIYPP
jgi:hypothetical protein